MRVKRIEVWLLVSHTVTRSRSYTSEFASVVKQLLAFNGESLIYILESIYLLLATAFRECTYVLHVRARYDWSSPEIEQNASAITISAALITL